MFSELNNGSGGSGGGNLVQLFNDALDNGEIPFVSGTFSNQNWTTDKNYSAVYLMMECDSTQDHWIKCGSKNGNSADAKYNSSITGSRVYRFDNVASGTVVGTSTTTFYGTIFAIE